MKILEILIQANGNVVSRNDLFDGVWPNQEISDQTLASGISRLRASLGDDPKQPRFIETIPKKGYRLKVPVHTGTAAIQSKARTARLALVAAVILLVTVGAILAFIQIGQGNAGGDSERDPPQSIAVLPFSNFSDDESAEYFGDGIADELLNALARMDGLLVASRTSSFQYKDTTNRSISEIGADLGVRYVIEGSVRRDGNTVRVTAQLIDAHNGFHRWSDTFDGPWSNLIER